jgi:hypothetical protein
MPISQCCRSRRDAASVEATPIHCPRCFLPLFWDAASVEATPIHDTHSLSPLSCPHCFHYREFQQSFCLRPGQHIVYYSFK